MLRLVPFFLLTLLFLATGATPRAQTPTRSPAAPASATASVAPALSESNAAPPASTPTLESLLNSMGSADLQHALQLVKTNFINPDALNETELDRALLAGVLARLGQGAMILERAPEDSAVSSQLFGEVLEGHVGYLRLGALVGPNLQAMDANLESFGAKKVDAIIIDLRASPATNDFAIAAEFAKRFTPKGKLLFTLRKPSAKQERAFTADRDPAFQGLIILLADSDTAGPAEAIAGVIRNYNKALVIGEPTAGQAVEYSDLPLSNGKVLRVAVAEAALPEGRALFPTGLKPDLPVEMPAADKRLVFQQSVEKGMAQFIFENGRPHLNEAALLAGKNPEIEAMELAQRRLRAGDKPTTRDPVLQRALDVITSLAVYQQR